MQLRVTFASTLLRSLLVPAALLMATIPALGAPLPQPDCVLVTVGMPNAGNPPLEPRTVRLTFTNNCGKDVTAVGFRFEGPGVEPFSSWTDLIGLLAQPGAYYVPEGQTVPVPLDILRAGGSYTFRHWVKGGAPFYMVTVTGVVFSDRTSIGDRTVIAEIQKNRRETDLPVAEEDLGILTKIEALDYKQAGVQLLEGRFKAKRSNAPYLGELKAHLAHDDEPTWRARVQEMIDRNRKLIQVLKDAVAGDDQGK
jgi:hypothetical protein